MILLNLVGLVFYLKTCRIAKLNSLIYFKEKSKWVTAFRRTHISAKHLSLDSSNFWLMLAYRQGRLPQQKSIF